MVARRISCAPRPQHSRSRTLLLPTQPHEMTPSLQGGGHVLAQRGNERSSACRSFCEGVVDAAPASRATWRQETSRCCQRLRPRGSIKAPSSAVFSNKNELRREEALASSCTADGSGSRASLVAAAASPSRCRSRSRASMAGERVLDTVQVHPSDRDAGTLATRSGDHDHRRMTRGNPRRQGRCGSRSS
jgi:hypothetical protein